MKRLVFCLLLAATAQLATGQKAPRSYEDCIRQGDRALQTGNFGVAIQKYFAAEAFDPSQRTAVQQRVEQVFAKMQALQQQTKEAEKQATRALQKLKTANAETKAALAKAEKLVNAFYFYDGKLALAYKNQRFGYINQEGDPVIDYKYESAEQFDRYGLAKVVLDGKDYLVDTLGNEYRVAYRQSELSQNVKAADFRNKSFTSFPEILKDHPQLEILLLDQEYDANFSAELDLRSLPALRILSLHNLGIEQLRLSPQQWGQLQILDLSDNRISRLPDSLLQANQLQLLNVSNNRLARLPDGLFQHTPRLKVLLLGQNQLPQLPEGIGSLKRLRYLNASGNQLRACPRSVTQLSRLEILDLSGNRMQDLPENLGELTALRELHLAANDLAELPASVQHCTKLEWLDLFNSPLSQSAQRDIRRWLPQANIQFPDPLALGTALYQRGAYPEALKAFQSANAEKSDPELLARISYCHYQMGDHAQAYDFIKQAIEMAPEDADAWHNLSFFALFVGQPEEAVSAARRSLEIDETNLTVKTNQALGLLLSGKYQEEAAPIYQRWKDEPYPDDPSQKWADIFLQDIEELEGAGVQHEDFQKVRALIKGQ